MGSTRPMLRTGNSRFGRPRREQSIARLRQRFRPFGAERRGGACDMARRPREPGRDTWKAHLAERRLHRLEEADGVEMWIVEQLVRRPQRRGWNAERPEQREPLLRRSLLENVRQEAVQRVDLTCPLLDRRQMLARPG